ncbi:MAG: type II toxin-antitoxin system HicB family antitoxin [Nitrospinae bacterium]|nr:type II toxin-antitoxin system HicB family antitoxin [Nitrospinota bacterium]
MTKTPEEYLKEPYGRILIPDEHGHYSAEILEFPGCFAEGATADEAIQALERAAKVWILAALDQGQEIPPPFMNQSFGGKVALRLPRSLHRMAARFAERDGTSLNQFLVTAIAARIGAEEFHNLLVEKVMKKVVNSLGTRSSKPSAPSPKAPIRRINLEDDAPGRA